MSFTLMLPFFPPLSRGLRRAHFWKSRWVSEMHITVKLAQQLTDKVLTEVSTERGTVGLFTTCCPTLIAPHKRPHTCLYIVQFCWIVWVGGDYKGRIHPASNLAERGALKLFQREGQRSLSLTLPWTQLTFHHNWTLSYFGHHRSLLANFPSLLTLKMAW